MNRIKKLKINIGKRKWDKKIPWIELKIKIKYREKKRDTLKD